MLIWNTNKLIQKYNDGEITNSQKFAYFFCVSILSSITTLLSSSLQNNSPDSFTLSLIIHLVVWILGVSFVYHKSKLTDPNNFVEKYFILLLPTTIKLIIIYYPIYFLLYTLLITPAEASTGPAIFLWCVQLAVSIIFYLYIGKKIQLLGANSIAT